MMQNNSEIKLSGEILAKYFKFFELEKRYLRCPFSINSMRVATFYKKNKKIFDDLYNLSIEKNLDVIGYISFFIKTLNKHDYDIKSDLLSNKYIEAFHSQLKLYEYYIKIYKYFNKSANNIVDGCIKNNFPSIKHYLRHLITNNLLVYEYVSGRISIYYLCCIHNFDKIIPTMDKISKDEFNILLTRFDKYNSDIQEAFLYLKSQKVNPIKYTENILQKQLTNCKN